MEHLNSDHPETKPTQKDAKDIHGSMDMKPATLGHASHDHHNKMIKDFTNQ
jgi:hypothetical protein